MRLYNTLTRKIETFTPQDPQKVKIYTCGPTVYNFAHIGNLASYVYWDLLIRTLLAKDWQPYRVMNITDVGHLSSDGDDGTDKLEKGAKREHKTVWEIADFYTKAFLADFYSLNLLEPAKIARATDYIKQDFHVIETLMKKGFTYQTSDGIYFDTSKFSTYPDFARLDITNLKAGARVDFNPEKRHASDFAIWKFIQENEDHAMRWDFLDRPGYPGWHLECSTISHEELGEPLDIHTGGIDHIPVHHTNEIAQSETAFDQKMCRFWLHCNFITIDGQKISKSLGNIYTLQDLSSRGFSPLDYKLWVLQGHFQSERNFTFQDLLAAKHRRLKWKNQIAELLQTSPSSQKTVRQDLLKTLASLQNTSLIEHIPKTPLSRLVLEKVENNLNSAEAFSLIDKSQPNLDDWCFIDSLFGLNLFFEQTPPNEEILTLILKREEARQNRDYKQADQLREQISKQKFFVKDDPNTPIWQYLE